MSNQATLLSHFYLTIQGERAPADLARAVEQITVENSLHLPDVATVTLHDPRLHWIDDDRLSPGRSLKVSAGFGRDETLLFDGEIVEIEPDFAASAQRLVVRAFDRLHRLNRDWQVRSFQNVTDGDLVQQLAKEARLKAEVGPTPQVHAYLLQANETNLAFLQRRAAALGYLLYVKGETLHCDVPRSEGTPVALAWGTSLHEFRPRLTTLGQVNSVTARGWDPDQRRAVMGQSRNGHDRAAARDGGELARAAFDLEARFLVADSPVREQPTAERLAQAVSDRMAGRFIEAEGVCGGNPALVAGATVQISAVGVRFSGAYFVTSTTHSFSSNQAYTTHFSISGLQHTTLLSLLAPEREPAPGMGLVIGIVTDNADPDGRGRVKVQYPWFSEKHSSDWARVVAVGGGKERGIQFLPEIDDEVLVGFEQGDINYPYVLGGLWNSIDTPPAPQGVRDGRVEQRVIRTRAGHELIFDDGDGSAGIIIRDNQGNQVKLDAVDGKLLIEAHGDLAISAPGDITLEGKNVLITGEGNVDVKAKEINLN